MLRLLARFFAEFALRSGQWRRSAARAWSMRQLDPNGGATQALGTIRCLWVPRIETLISRGSPPLNCVLLLIGLGLALSHPLAHLSWYGLAPVTPGSTADACRVLLKLMIFIGVLTVVGAVTPGPHSRKIFAAVTFPFLALLGLATISPTGSAIHELARISTPSLVETLLRGSAVGTFVASAISLPSALIYRRTATSVAILALMPSVAKLEATARAFHANLLHPGQFTDPLCSLICCAIAIVVLTTLCYRRLT